MYTTGKKTRCYGSMTGYPIYETLEDALEDAESRCNPVGYDIYKIVDNELHKVDS